MKKCLIIINSAAGKSGKISFEKVEKRLGDAFAYSHFLLPDDGEYSLDGFDTVAVAGGDGTLGTLLEKAGKRPIDVYYFPSGTLNDKAKSRYSHLGARGGKMRREERANTPVTPGRSLVLGKYFLSPALGRADAESGKDMHASCEVLWQDVATSSPNEYPLKKYPQACPNDFDKADLHSQTIISPQSHADKLLSDGKDIPSREGVFSYVLAAGSFTPIGYAADVKLKKKIGALAYVLQILKQFKPYRIGAKIRCGNKTYEGDFTLIMVVKSPRCFGFRFNRAYDPDSISGHLVAIRSPKHGGLLGKIEMFFPFFRVFFLGLRSEREGRIIFKKIYSCDITHSSETVYCRDGEKYAAKQGVMSIGFSRSLCNFKIIEKF